MTVEVRNLTRRFEGFTAVDNISFTLEDGHVYGFIGPNGAGKTTTMRIMATLDRPDEGDIFMDGRSTVLEVRWARRLIGFMPDSLPAYRDISVHEYLDFFARAYGIENPKRRTVLERIEKFTDTFVLKDKVLGQLSKGMKQRVSLARALLHDPRFLILDEPAAGLDPNARIHLRELIAALSKQGKTIFISSHILEELTEICEGAVIIERGRILRAGKLDQVFDPEPLRRVSLRCIQDQETVYTALLEFPHGETAGVAGGDEAWVEINADDHIQAELVRFLIDRGIQVVECRAKKQDLQAVFKKVTKGEVQ